MNTLLNKIDRALSFKGLFALLLALLMIPFPTASAAGGGGGHHMSGYNRPDCDPNYDLPIVVSMGDSYSSGEGIEPFFYQDLGNKKKVKEEDWLAHRSEKSWPALLKIPGLDNITFEYKDSNWLFVASSGATTEHLESSQLKSYSVGAVGQYSDENVPITPQLEVFDKLKKNSVDYVTLTLGGNDADFEGIITEGVVGSTYLNTSELADDLAKIWKKFYAKGGIRDDLYDSYKKIEAKAGSQAQIIVAGYPKLLEQSGKGCPFSIDEAVEINRAVSNFNIEIERIVDYCADEGMQISFVSVEEAFDGHEAYSKNPYINKVILGSEPEELKNFVAASSYSMHPNDKGAVKYASCVNDKIKYLAEKKEAELEENALNPTAKDREIVLVLDGSSSMSGEPLKETKSAAKKFVETVFDNTDANVGVITYNYSATVASAMTDSEEYLKKRIEEIGASGGTNIEAGLSMADGMLAHSKASKRIIVLMSDGEPNNGKVGNELISYANKLKEKGYYVYTLGFFSAVGNKSAAYNLMEKIASDGCHFEVDDAESLQFFFGDIADQITGTNYVYVRIACPVDVTVEYKGEILSSKGNLTSQRTSFGTMTFEDAVEEVVEEEEVKEESPAAGSLGGLDVSNPDDEEEEEDEVDETDVYDNRVKILRLKEGVDYEVKIEGNGKGKMDYSIGFMNKNGEYKDVRKFSDVEISWKTKIDTVATRAEETYMYVDEDGDGEYDLAYMAEEGGEAEIVEIEEEEKEKKSPNLSLYFALASLILLAGTVIVSLVTRHYAIKKYLPA